MPVSAHTFVESTGEYEMDNEVSIQTGESIAARSAGAGAAVSGYAGWAD